MPDHLTSNEKVSVIEALRLLRALTREVDAPIERAAVDLLESEIDRLRDVEALTRTTHEPSARQCNHGAISPKGTMLYHGYVQPKANLWRCDVCKGIYEGNLTEPNTLGSQALTLVGPSEPPSDDLAFPLDARVREVFGQTEGTIVAIDTRYEVECTDGKHRFYWHRQLERVAETKSAGECGACDKPGEHCANVHGICSRHGGRAHETGDVRE